MTNMLRVTFNALGSTLRGWRGTMALQQTQPPEKPLKLYEFEACPYCRLVRETLTELDLDALILPCPKGGHRFRDEAVRLGGKAQFPLLVDENTGVMLYESKDIIDYLRKQYGQRGSGPSALVHWLNVSSSSGASAIAAAGSINGGMMVRASTAPDQPLILFSFETSPYSKIVRDRLCELELPYVLRNTGKGHWRDLGPPSFRDQMFKGELRTTRNRSWLADNTGKVQVPYLIDPNTGVAMYESGDIIEYLNQTYAR